VSPAFAQVIKAGFHSDEMGSPSATVGGASAGIRPASDLPVDSVAGFESLAVGSSGEHFAGGRRRRHLEADLAAWIPFGAGLQAAGA
jgi:hypothetical protein